MRCPRCGNENPESNRFCGMCGTTLLAPAPPKAQPPAPTPIRTEVAPARAAEPARTSAPVSSEPETEETPGISGPSFLGLNSPAPSRPAPRKRASLSIDPHSVPDSQNLDYLLEDEDEPRGSGLWKFALILIALGLAVGFGYLRWKGQGFAWLQPPKKPAVTSTDSGATDGNTPAPSVSATAPATAPSITPEPQPASTTPPSASQPPAQSITAIGAGSSSANGTPAGNSAPAAGNSSVTSAPAANNGSKPASAANSSASPTSTTVPTPGAPDKDDSDAANNGAASDDSDESSAPAPQPEAKAPAAKPKAAIPVDPVAQAQKYLYGRGVAQDCDRGLRLLKPAANQSNTKAMIEMGALYSAGLCTPRDLPTAYRWFAMALHKDPDNESVQADLQKLWSEMTQPERQLAIKLSQ